MNRRHLTFECAGETLLGTIDEAPGTTGLLIVTGGNEIRAGAHRAMAMLAARLASAGTPVFRYDRRGVGDSSGSNRTFANASEDLLAAAATFRAVAPQVSRLIGFGNCDAATSLAWWGNEAGCNSVVLANPWVVESAANLPPPAAIKAHYLAQLQSPAAWKRIATRGLSPAKLLRGLKRIAAREEATDLTSRTLEAIARWGDRATVILARGDGTAIAYADAARRAGIFPRTITIDTGSHSFARPGDAVALERAIRSVLSAP
ncbi:hydrolase 1, exosortase A system-associated [Sphingomonas sp. IC4-52]|uniref:hydrolase 1, exosortase A system-associated n=1 Tax=Sphingomonas sp. IC4-52 TaxID=2887202 RepID=UPI001D120D33|nr:hydrolase 1, exosortase A system-associated [Sphingomonas sp. IC4-52]MCC2979649.1 hydrolase 1, exosortase A system-associated [Sphingomonas sp. IC4-52]